MTLEPIDLHHQGADRIIASYVLETDDGLALFDCGPSTTIAALEHGLGKQGLALTEIRHLLLSHIHLDHAGAAGTLVRMHPHLQVHVSEIGAPHLVDPSRLERSARRLYGDTFDTLWGELAPIPQENIRVVGDRVLGLECFPSRGHAEHHVCYLDRDGTLYAGDAAGVRITPGRYVVPPTPPPELDVEARIAIPSGSRSSISACSRTCSAISPTCSSSSTTGPTTSAAARPKTSSSVTCGRSWRMRARRSTT